MTIKRNMPAGLLAALGLLLTACAGNAPTQRALSDSDCPAGQVLVCQGGQGNSRIKDSKLNENDICTCRLPDFR